MLEMARRVATKRTPALSCALLLVTLLTFDNRRASAQQVDPGFWITNGAVAATALVGDTTLFLAGGFDHVGPYTGGGVLVDPLVGTVRPGSPKVHGRVMDAIPDGSGGWFIAGSFDSVGSSPRRNLAHVRSDLVVDPSTPDVNEQAVALGLSGTTLYIAGSFTAIGGVARSCIGAIDLTTNAVVDWDPSAQQSINGYPNVMRMVVLGSQVFVYGDFTSIGGQPRRWFAALDRNTALATDWTPGPVPNVNAMLAVGPSLFIAGCFDSLGAEARHAIAAVDTVTGHATDWTTEVDGCFSSIAVQDSLLYVAGQFSHVGGQDRNRLAVLSLATGLATDWNPSVAEVTFYSQITQLLPAGNLVYVATEFQEPDHYTQRHLLALDATTGERAPWDPVVDDFVWVLAGDGSNIYVGGNFMSAGGVVRPSLAAIDVRTGRATDWSAETMGANNLFEAGGKLYVSGLLLTVRGEPRQGLAAFDLSTGELTSLAPIVGGIDHGFGQALCVESDTVYLGGRFTEVNGLPRGNLAAIDATTGQLLDWHPDVTDGVQGQQSFVDAIVAGNGKVYVGGNFTEVDGEQRVGVAAIDAATGQVSASFHSPILDGTVLTLHLAGPRLFVGGAFQLPGNSGDGSLVTLDAETGEVVEGDSQIAGDAPVVYAIGQGNPVGASGIEHRGLLAQTASTGSTLFLSGHFATVEGLSRPNAAAIDIASGAVTGWSVGTATDANVFAISVGTRTYLGGDFTSVGGVPARGIVALAGSALTDVPRPKDSKAGIVLERPAPNPAHLGVQIRMRLSTMQTVSLDLFDTSGRRVRQILAAAPLESGEHDFSIRRGTLAAGLYFVRMRSGTIQRSQKLVLLP